MKLGKVINYNITIEPSQNNGFIVKIGCGRFVAENVDSLLKQLTEYLSDPTKIEKRYDTISPDIPEAAALLPASEEAERTEPA